MPAEARLKIGGCDLLIVGTITGFVPDSDRVRAAFASHDPQAVALGIPKEDLAALSVLAHSTPEDMSQPDAIQDRFLALLSRFGETRIPSPDLQEAHAAAAARGAPLEAIDMDDETHAAVYVQKVKVRHLWMAPRREKRLVANAFEEAKDAYDFAIQWDLQSNAPRPLREVEGLREETMARRLREVCANRHRVLAIVPVARMAGLLQRLTPGTV